MGILHSARRKKGVLRGRRSRLSRLLFVLIALSVVFPAIAGSLAARPLHETGVFEDRIVICTGSGLKVIRLDENGDPLPDREEHYDIAPGLCVPMATAALAEFQDGLFVQLRRPPLPELPHSVAVVFPPHETDHPPAPTRGPPVSA